MTLKTSDILAECGITTEWKRHAKHFARNRSCGLLGQLQIHTEPRTSYKLLGFVQMFAICTKVWNSQACLETTQILTESQSHYNFFRNLRDAMLFAHIRITRSAYRAAFRAALFTAEAAVATCASHAFAPLKKTCIVSAARQRYQKAWKGGPKRGWTQ